MTTSHTTPSISRRAALAGLGAGGLGVALAAATRHAAAQEGATAEAMATHPIVGNWMVTTFLGRSPAMAVFLADGTNIQGAPRHPGRGRTGWSSSAPRSARGNP